MTTFILDWRRSKMRKHGLNERRIGALTRLEAKRKPTQKDVEEIKILKERIRK
jgi:hypothetical protein|tara:strand:- start:363 stop:521 length:159 start_codon:yes stop_codon:yes gene_type:complete